MSVINKFIEEFIFSGFNSQTANSFWKAVNSLPGRSFQFPLEKNFPKTVLLDNFAIKSGEYLWKIRQNEETGQV